jgi:hypothetical protein
MPCVPIGMTVTCGRTSRLNRFLSMPRYDGASRSRMKRGLPTHVLTADVQVSDASDAVRARFCLSSATCASSGAGMSARSRVTHSAAFQWKAQLASRQPDWTRSAYRLAAHEADIVGEPLEDVTSQPADPPAVKTTSSREATEQRQRSEYPAMAPCQAGYVMSRQQLLERGKSLIDSLRE